MPLLFVSVSNYRSLSLITVMELVSQYFIRANARNSKYYLHRRLKVGLSGARLLSLELNALSDSLENLLATLVS